MVDTMVKRFGHTKVGLLTWTGGWGVTGRGELQRRLKENGCRRSPTRPSTTTTPT